MLPDKELQWRFLLLLMFRRGTGIGAGLEKSECGMRMKCSDFTRIAFRIGLACGVLRNAEGTYGIARCVGGVKKRLARDRWCYSCL